jgi:ferredoxin
MARYKVIYDREGCIGAFACAAAAPDFWKYEDDGKATLAQAAYNAETKRWELLIDEKDLEENQAAADVCPVQVIVIEKVEEKEEDKKKEERSAEGK